ncbi:phosphotransferase family protein [Sphingopyxis sp. YR583]|uniref:phosphotransferase family protein n=1 Tax=Sphingopyxis sp. YR583 TaxID=1881047 RepID=UPI0015A523E6|nr:phosphotransferase family protein [Sphingopyxis sp. YR583]
MIDRQALFEGTETPSEGLHIIPERLAAVLRERLGLDTSKLNIEKFKGGQSNPTYRVDAGAKSIVLRKRPPGVLVKSAHAIDREFAVISALHARGFAAPEPLLYVEDESILGTAFYLVEYVDGRIFWNADLPGLDPMERGAIYAGMNRFLAELHSLPKSEIDHLVPARGGDYVARNLARWNSIYDQSELADIPDMARLANDLRAAMPPAQPAVMIHGDYGLYNIIVEKRGAGIAAVLDWEMATRGDALVDLAHHLRAWWDIPDHEAGSTSSLAGLDLAALGIPDMDSYADLYFSNRGLQKPSNFAYYLAFAQYRYAAMIQGILKRAATGTASSRRVLHRQERVAAIARMAVQTLECL